MVTGHTFWRCFIYEADTNLTHDIADSPLLTGDADGFKVFNPPGSLIFSSSNVTA